MNITYRYEYGLGRKFWTEHPLHGFYNLRFRTNARASMVEGGFKTRTGKPFNLFEHEIRRDLQKAQREETAWDLIRSDIRNSAKYIIILDQIADTEPEPVYSNACSLIESAEWVMFVQADSSVELSNGFIYHN